MNGFESEIKQASKGLSRRECLKRGLLAAAGALLPVQAMARMAEWSSAERALSFYNLHTGEQLKEAVFWIEGRYIPETLEEINHLLRDYRTDEVESIDPNLLSLLYRLKGQLPTGNPFHVISGYRSPQTNTRLRQNGGGGVAKNSLHMVGQAIDIRVPGCDLSVLHKSALALKSGGVGYYPSSDFVHLDTGRVRWWSGS